MIDPFDKIIKSINPSSPNAIISFFIEEILNNHQNNETKLSMTIINQLIRLSISLKLDFYIEKEKYLKYNYPYIASEILIHPYIITNFLCFEEEFSKNEIFFIENYFFDKVNKDNNLQKKFDDVLLSIFSIISERIFEKNRTIINLEDSFGDESKKDNNSFTYKEVDGNNSNSQTNQSQLEIDNNFKSNFNKIIKSLSAKNRFGVNKFLLNQNNSRIVYRYLSLIDSDSIYDSFLYLLKEEIVLLTDFEDKQKGISYMIDTMLFENKRVEAGDNILSLLGDVFENGIQKEFIKYLVIDNINLHSKLISLLLQSIKEINVDLNNDPCEVKIKNNKMYNEKLVVRLICHYFQSIYDLLSSYNSNRKRCLSGSDNVVNSILIHDELNKNTSQDDLLNIKTSLLIFSNEIIEFSEIVLIKIFKLYENRSVNRLSSLFLSYLSSFKSILMIKYSLQLKSKESNHDKNYFLHIIFDILFNNQQLNLHHNQILSLFKALNQCQLDLNSPAFSWFFSFSSYEKLFFFLQGKILSLVKNKKEDFFSFPFIVEIVLVYKEVFERYKNEIHFENTSEIMIVYDLINKNIFGKYMFFNRKYSHSINKSNESHSDIVNSQLYSDQKVEIYENTLNEGFFKFIYDFYISFNMDLSQLNKRYVNGSSTYKAIDDKYSYSSVTVNSMIIPMPSSDFLNEKSNVEESFKVYNSCNKEIKNRKYILNSPERFLQKKL